jgi:hypothetical protein
MSNATQIGGKCKKKGQNFMYNSAKIVAFDCTHFSSLKSGQMCVVGILYTKFNSDLPL